MEAHAVGLATQSGRHRDDACEQNHERDDRRQEMPGIGRGSSRSSCSNSAAIGNRAHLAGRTQTHCARRPEVGRGRVRRGRSECGAMLAQ